LEREFVSSKLNILSTRDLLYLLHNLINFPKTPPDSSSKIRGRGTVDAKREF